MKISKSLKLFGISLALILFIFVLIGAETPSIFIDITNLSNLQDDILWNGDFNNTFDGRDKGGNPFNQSLNTTDSVRFYYVSVKGNDSGGFYYDSNIAGYDFQIGGNLVSGNPNRLIYIGSRDRFEFVNMSNWYSNLIAGGLFASRNLTVSGDSSLEGDLNVTKNITASYYFGDGSQLTNLPSSNSNPFNQSLNTTDDVVFNEVNLSNRLNMGPNKKINFDDRANIKWDGNDLIVDTITGGSSLNNQLIMKGHIYPDADRTYKLGDVNSRWSGVYSYIFDANNNYGTAGVFNTNANTWTIQVTQNYVSGLRWVSLGGAVYSAAFGGGDVAFAGDDLKTVWGASQDVSSNFNSSDQVVNAEVGAPNYYFTGFDNIIFDSSIKTKGNLTIRGNYISNGTDIFSLKDLNATGNGENATKEIFYPATALSPEGEVTAESTAIDILSMSSTGSFRLNFYIPSDFTGLTGIFVVVVPDTTEIIQYDLTGSHASVGQLINQSEQSSLNEQTSVTDNTIAELNVSSVFSGIGAGDYAGLEFKSDTTNIRVLGVRIKYS